VYWPAMLISAGLPLPERVFGHGFLTREGQKMGKSLGNVLDPQLLLERCGSDAVRWYLLREIPFGDDGDFQQQRFVDLVNNDLANTIGNLLNRTIAMARRWFDGAVPDPGEAAGTSHALAVAAADANRTYEAAWQRLDFRAASEAALGLAIAANGYLNDQAPWSRMKQEGQREQVSSDLYAVLEAARFVAQLLAPLVPLMSARMLAQLPAAPAPWPEQLRWGGLTVGAPLPEPTPVMARLELEGQL